MAARASSPMSPWEDPVQRFRDRQSDSPSASPPMSPGRDGVNTRQHQRQQRGRSSQKCVRSSSHAADHLFQHQASMHRELQTIKNREQRLLRELQVHQRTYGAWINGNGLRMSPTKNTAADAGRNDENEPTKQADTGKDSSILSRICAVM